MRTVNKDIHSTIFYISIFYHVCFCFFCYVYNVAHTSFTMWSFFVWSFYSYQRVLRKEFEIYICRYLLRARWFDMWQTYKHLFYIYYDKTSLIGWWKQFEMQKLWSRAGHCSWEHRNLVFIWVKKKSHHLLLKTEGQSNKNRKNSYIWKFVYPLL